MYPGCLVQGNGLEFAKSEFYNYSRTHSNKAKVFIPLCYSIYCLCLRIVKNEREFTMFSVLRDNEVLLESFKCFIERKLEPYKELKYAYVVLNKKDPSDVLIVSSYPDEWVKRYNENNFHRIDPVIFKACRQSSPFAWDENIALVSGVKFNKIFQLSRKYNIVNGYTFVLHDHINNLAILSFVADDNVGDCENLIKPGVSSLQMLLIEINEQMYKLSEVMISGGMQRHNQSKNSPFTERENEVIYWISKGKNYADIASIIDISLSTVKFHVKNIVKKLGVNNMRQAIALSVELDLIMPVLIY